MIRFMDGWMDVRLMIRLMDGWMDEWSASHSGVPTAGIAALFNFL